MPRRLAGELGRALAEAGTTRMFGVPGGGPNLDVIGCAAELGVDFVLTHSETAACIMAAVYGRLTATTGVALTTRGPGMTSAVNGLAQATLDRFPLLLLTDTVSAEARPRNAHQRLDQIELARPVTKWSARLGSANTADAVRAALELARRPPAGAVHLACDATVAGDVAASLSPSPTPIASDDDIARVRSQLRLARRPVVVVGVDAVGNSDAVRAGVATLGCPVLVTYQAKGVMPESSPLYAGLFTGSALERPLLNEADLVLGIGLDPVEAMPGTWSTGGPTVLVHRYPMEIDYFGSAHLLIGDYDRVLRGLAVARAGDWPPDTGLRFRTDAMQRMLAYASTGLTPISVVQRVHVDTGDVLATVDAGAHMLAVMPFWRTDEPGSVLISNGLATMGFALPAALAMGLAHPERRVVAFTGDGGLAMVLGELETLARLDLNVTVVVLNDAALTLIALKQGPGQGGEHAVTHRRIDFAAVAQGFGITARVATDLDTLSAALRAVPPGGGPLLVDARIDPAQYGTVIEVTRGSRG